MIEGLVLLLGYIVILLFGIFMVGLLLLLIYQIYNYALKQLLGWNKIELRRDLFYFIAHKKKIREIVRNIKSEDSHNPEEEKK